MDDDDDDILQCCIRPTGAEQLILPTRTEDEGKSGYEMD
jgi:hypothetical protein